MRHSPGALVLLVLLAGCVRAETVDAGMDGVVYRWQDDQASLGGVYNLATNYCTRWNTPAHYVSDAIEDGVHTTVFACKPRPDWKWNGHIGVPSFSG